MATKKDDEQTNDVAEQSVRLTRPKGAEGPPPEHVETLGALPTAPPEIAEEYSKTGITPKSAWRDAQTEGVNLDKLKGHGGRSR